MTTEYDARKFSYWREHDFVDAPKRDTSTRDEHNDDDDIAKCEKNRQRALKKLRKSEPFDRAAFAVVDGTNLAIAPSTIPNAGNGLFARRDFAANERITIYEGEIITYTEAVARRARKEATHLRAHIQREYAIDGLKLSDGTPITDPITQVVGIGGGAFANDNKGGEANAEFDWVDSPANEAIFKQIMAFSSYARLDPKERITFLRATRAIKAGEEIFIDYGEDYWSEQS
jgi:hypothetical protein